MKEEIGSFKIDFARVQKIEMMLENFFIPPEARMTMQEEECVKMLDLNHKISYGSQYIEIFKNKLRKEDFKIAKEKYDFKRINEHLEKILEEYTQLTDELDEIIFKEE